jgi:hypothetical protein
VSWLSRTLEPRNMIEHSRTHGAQLSLLAPIHSQPSISVYVSSLAQCTLPLNQIPISLMHSHVSGAITVHTPAPQDGCSQTEYMPWIWLYMKDPRVFRQIQEESHTSPVGSLGPREGDCPQCCKRVGSVRGSECSHHIDISC